jgi:hypothetical protein
MGRLLSARALRTAEAASGAGLVAFGLAVAAATAARV